MVKSGEWKALFLIDGQPMTCEDLFQNIVEYYGLDESVHAQLCLSYDTRSKNGRTKKKERFQTGLVVDGRTYIDIDGQERLVHISQLELSCCVEKGVAKIVDVSCDS